MQRLPKCISSTAIAFAAVLVLSQAHAEDLQWVHSSQQKAAAKPVVSPRTATKVGGRSQAQAPSLPAKQPTFRQPQTMQPAANAKPLASATKVGAPAVGPNPAPRLASAPMRNPRQPQGRGVVRTQHAEYEEIAAPQAMHSGPSMHEGPVMEFHEGDMGGYELGESMYYGGEVGCGCPEPTCGCSGPCSCGGCVVGEPGCGFTGPTCSTPCCGDCVEGGCTCGDACGCGDACCDESCPPWPQALFGCDDRGCVPILWAPPVKEFVLFAGVHGFKNPLDGNRDGGNFGFQEGFNLGGKMAWLPWPGLGYQFGYQATQSQLSGDSNSGTNGAHSQHFATIGLFERNPMGLQWGVVWDFLHDERQGANDYGQVRGEIGFKNCTSREFGFMFAVNSNKNQIDDSNYRVADQFLFYYRLYGHQGGDLRAYAGLSDDGNGIFGSEFQLPLNDRWSLQGNWRYLIPKEGENGSGADEEAWNLGMNLVWHYGCRAKSWNSRPYRPMFNVADNGSLIVVD